MKYKITIERIENKPRKEEVYISDDERTTEDGDRRYRYVLMDKEIHEEIYSQTTDSEIDLKSVIDAFNGIKPL